jgi:SAM-dependent methyltransferase
VTDTDRRTAEAFASSWNTVREGSVYSREQFLDWMAPVSPDSVAGLSVLELGFGNGSLLAHMGTLGPKSLTGIELGDTLEATRRNLAHLPAGLADLRRGDLVTADLGTFDLVYCIGVLHHLADPDAGFRSLLRHTRPGGRFHAWVYAREGNALVRLVVEPIRRVASRLPWWVTKYGLALPLVVPFFLYARLLRALARRTGRPVALERLLPLAAYALWIAERPFWFFHHVAFDQLVTPRTTYFDRRTVERWLASPVVEPANGYVVFRNGNSWKFGGRRRADVSPEAPRS